MTEPPKRIRITFDVATQSQEAELRAAWQEIVAGKYPSHELLKAIAL
jgi:hypothetical protein